MRLLSFLRGLKLPVNYYQEINNLPVAERQIIQQNLTNLSKKLSTSQFPFAKIT